MRLFLVPIATIGLTACGATTPASPPLAPTPSQNSFFGSGSQLGGDVPSSGAPNITFGGAPVVGVTKLSPSDGSSYGWGEKTTGSSFNVVAFSDDGKASQGAVNIVSATTIAVSDAEAGGFGSSFGQLATYRRDSTSILPSSGTGTFQGDYRGTIGGTGLTYPGHTHTAGSPVAVGGNVTLNANFNAMNISGNISSRTILLPGNAGGGNAIAAVTLGATSIDGNGQYSGTASSGPINGSYSGLIGGASGTGMAGSLNLDHNGGLNELGVFTAIRTGP